ncbi:hypothetical protein [Rubrivirga sp. IMCC45206]|uniref:hypothetical protein n=1 Tax=Rubrivirga sp. IMCC45206 TaxID=3391614 RepID=UPI003990250D
MSRTAAGAWAGFAAGMAMALAMMGWMLATGRSPWTTPDLIAAMWLGDGVADGALGLPTLVGFATHQATSALLGGIAVPFVRDLSPGRTVLAAVAYAVASYPVVFALVLTWANPLMVAETSLIPMTLAHALFGVVLAVVYLRLRALR